MEIVYNVLKGVYRCYKTYLRKIYTRREKREKRRYATSEASKDISLTNSNLTTKL